METENHLKTLYLHITKHCNLQCLYYYLEESLINEDLTSSQIASIKGDLSLLKTERIIFTGGEPLLRKDIIDIAEEFKSTRKCLKLCLNTNGTLINKGNSEIIVRNFDEIRINIDGFREENDAIRGKKTFGKAIIAFNEIIKAGGDPIAFITVGSSIINSIKDFMRFLRAIGVNRLHVSPLRLIGHAKNNKGLLCNNDLIVKTVSEFWQKTFGLELRNTFVGNEKVYNCFTCKHLNIYPDGSVYPCHVLSYPELCLGNIKTRRLSEIYLKSQLLRKLRTLDFQMIFPDSPNKQMVGNQYCFGQFSDEIFLDRLFELIMI